MSAYGLSPLKLYTIIQANLRIYSSASASAYNIFLVLFRSHTISLQKVVVIRKNTVVSITRHTTTTYKATASVSSFLYHLVRMRQANKRKYYYLLTTLEILRIKLTVSMYTVPFSHLVLIHSFDLDFPL